MRLNSLINKKLMGPAVGALGSLAGGMLAQKLMPKKKSMDADTSIPGILSAQVKKGGKNGEGAINVAQVDPSGAINYFQKAAKQMEDYSMKGLGLYNASMLQAISELEPMKKTGDQATNKYLQMMGLKDMDGKTLTPEQISAQLTSTPGYQFQLQQGTQATARNALAAGGISGNTLAASQNYGQQVAQGTFQQYLSNLNPLMSQGNAARTNISNLYGQAGTTNLNTMQNIGSSYYGAGMKSGDTTFQAALANMAAQNAAMEAQRGREAAQSQQAIASGPGYMNAATESARFNYGVFQNQQAGQSFYGQSTGWPTYNPNSNSWAV